jgi:caffeoyl-CoA O-methyltransferase
VRSKYLELTPDLYEYVVRVGARQDAVLARVEKDTEDLGSIAVMQIAPDQGALITLLVKAAGARRALEVGTFTGYSAICIARGLPDDGELVCCELSDEYARTARANLDAAGVSDRVRMEVGPAAETLAALPADDPFDFAFIDADKGSYPTYYELVLERLRPGGLVMLDNMLLGGRVLDPDADDESAATLRDLNESIAADDRVDAVLLPLADGITVARKRA